MHDKKPISSLEDFYESEFVAKAEMAREAKRLGRFMWGAFVICVLLAFGIHAIRYILWSAENPAESFIVILVIIIPSLGISAGVSILLAMLPILTYEYPDRVNILIPSLAIFLIIIGVGLFYLG
ncbi:MAG: hypothetical protein AB8F95_01055 [Bacteroidia bacterium]